MSRKPQYHYSSLEAASRCGISFQNRYLLRIPESRSVAMVTGSAVDAGISANLDHKKQTGELLPLSDVRDITRDALVKEWKDGSEVRLNNDSAWVNGENVTASEEDQDEGWSAQMGDAIDAVVDLAEFHHAEVAPVISPTGVQHKFVLDVDPPKNQETGDLLVEPFQVAGAIDIVEGAARIRDSKCTGKSPQKDLAHKSLQLTVYAVEQFRETGEWPKEVQLDKLVRTPKRHDLKYVPLTSTRGPEDFPPLAARLVQLALSVQSGTFLPAPVDSWVCGPKYCGFFATCPFAVKRPYSVAVNGSK